MNKINILIPALLAFTFFGCEEPPECYEYDQYRCPDMLIDYGTCVVLNADTNVRVEWNASDYESQSFVTGSPIILEQWTVLNENGDNFTESEFIFLDDSYLLETNSNLNIRSYTIDYWTRHNTRVSFGIKWQRLVPRYISGDVFSEEIDFNYDLFYVFNLSDGTTTEYERTGWLDSETMTPCLHIEIE